MAIIVLNGRTGLKGQEANFCPSFLHPCEEYMHLQWTLWLGVQKVGPWDKPCSYLRRSYYNRHAILNLIMISPSAPIIAAEHLLYGLVITNGSFSDLRARFF